MIAAQRQVHTNERVGPFENSRSAGGASSDPCAIEYGGEMIRAARGQRLLDAILDAGYDHRHICGGRGFCTSCRIEVIAEEGGLSPVSALERERLGRDAGRLRLACQSLVCGDARIRVPVPASSRFSPDGD